MNKYIINKCKKSTWIMLLVVMLGAISTIMANYIYKIIGMIIDYGLNYSGKNYSGELGFLFTGKYGAYGSLDLIITLSVSLVICAIISYIAILLSYYIQKRGQNYIANQYRKEIYTKSKGKKLPFNHGDMMVLLHEDIYEVPNTFISYYSAIISGALSIAYTIFMLNSISAYLLITPIALTPLLVYFSIKYHKETYKQNQKYRAIDGELKENIAECIGSENKGDMISFSNINKKHTNSRKHHSLVSNKYNTILNLVKLLIYITSCTVAGVLAIKGIIMIGEYLIFTTFVNTIYTQILSLISNSISIKSAQPRVEKVKILMEEHLNEN